MSLVKMRRQRPSKVVKPIKNNRRTTLSSRNHRFQPFTERIANLKIDPIRRRRNGEDREELSDKTETYFGRSLVHWQELNLSQTFTGFCKDAASLCDSLPMVLLNEDKIMHILVSYIEKGDSLALEPLLSMMAHFAHDLEARFEKYFSHAVTTITSMAAKHSDPAVIEWSFTCLAWLFKYLSRLLIPDLRPLYDLMSPYLGKVTQKPYIIRFAAESMSFLIRKAAAMYDRDPVPLKLIINHMLDDSFTAPSIEGLDLHDQGVMTLLTEAMKGVQNGLHSSGTVILHVLLQHVEDTAHQDMTPKILIICGVLTSMIHHTIPGTFAPLQDIVLDHLASARCRYERNKSKVGARLIFTITTVRKGARVTRWTDVVKTLQDYVEQGLSSDLDDGVRSAILSALGAVMQLAPMNAVLPALQVFEKLRRPQWTAYFLRFCDLYLRLGYERFKSFLAPHLQAYLGENEWDDDDHTVNLWQLLSISPCEIRFDCPDTLGNYIVHRLDRLLQENPSEADGFRSITLANLLLKALSHLNLPSGLRQHVNGVLLQPIRGTSQEAQRVPCLTTFTFGACFRHLLEHVNSLGAITDLWPLLCSASADLYRLPLFWSNVLTYLKHEHERLKFDIASIRTLESSLLRCLASASHQCRQAALEIFVYVYGIKRETVPDVLNTAITIESTPINLATTRTISMNIRRLSQSYSMQTLDPIMQQAMPTFCFGLLHLQLAQAWEDAFSALSEMSRTPMGEDTITSLAQRWLEAAPDVEEGSEGHKHQLLDTDTAGFQVASDFECPNQDKLSAICEQVFKSVRSGHPTSDQQFNEDHLEVSEITSTAREQALKILNRIPTIAEKRSRMLVPVLLRWTGEASIYEDNEESPARWNRKDQKLMLAVFAQFTNPRVLYKSSEVYQALLSLCANGDVEIQRSALKALLAWKFTGLSRYEEHLNHLLDEARLRDELPVFLQGTDSEDAVIRAEDHAQLMPVLLRLLYGRAIAGGKYGQDNRRKTIFGAISRLGDTVLRMFIDIALGPLGTVVDLSADNIDAALAEKLVVSARKQLGLLNMINDMLDTMGATMEAFSPQIMRAALLCTISASRQLESRSGLSDTSLARSVRHSGLQCLVRLFLSAQHTDFASEAKLATDELISPRLVNFTTENMQSVSAMLRLLSAWTATPRTARYLIAYDSSLLGKISDLLREPGAKEDVRLFVLTDILDNLLEGKIGNLLRQDHVVSFVQSIGLVLRSQPRKDVLDACVVSLSQFAEHISEQCEAESVIAVCTDLLTKPSRMVSPSTKTGLLRTMIPLAHFIDINMNTTAYDAISGLFSRLRDQDSRTVLSTLIAILSGAQEDLMKSSAICQDLNALGIKLNDVDYDRCERGFVDILKYSQDFSLRQWLPIVHNCLFYVRDSDDTVNRSSASRALQCFVKVSASNTDTFKPLIINAIIPGIEYGMKSSSELVRAEYVALIGHLVECYPEWSAVNDMRCLTMSGDDEASFFTNILHIQQHRRLRALRRLGDVASDLSSTNVTRFLIPLLEHFVFDPAEGDAGRTLADQTIVTLGDLGRALSWSAFRATFKRYIGVLQSKEDAEKAVLRLLRALTDSLTSQDKRLFETKLNGARQTVAETITRDFIPPLKDYIHHKDESTVDRRMPVAITIVKLLLLLPEDEVAIRLAPVLTDVCHVLRSRSQEARDQTRRTLSVILALVGPSYFRFMLKELRGALQRGYQLHVLSFTVHSLLLAIVDHCQPGDIDDCLSEMTSIVMDDIFGVTGQEKDAEEYKSGMKEIKNGKSFDTMELLAKLTPILRLGHLVQPIRALLSERLDAKTLKKIDELLTRLRRGLDQNPAIDSQDVLVFCYEIVRDVHGKLHVQPTQSDKKVEREKNRYLIQMDSANKSKSKVITTTQLFKLACFGLDLLRKVLRRHEDLMTPSNMAGFLPMAGDALVQGQEEVQLASLRLLSTIMKVHLPELEANAPVYVKACVTLIKTAPTMTTDITKGALELITAVLREKRSVAIRERDIGQVLSALKSDLDEPDQQGIIYKFLRAVIGRQIVNTEVYEIMDEVGKVIVTNPDRTVRESGRSTYLQFILSYPQGKDRWNKQAAFFVENLKYERPAGRQSVMELLHQLLSKLSDEVLEQLAFTLFVALVPVQTSDTDHECRQMAGLLISRLFERARDKQYGTFVSLLDKWISKDSNTAIQLAALQCWKLLLRIRAPPAKRIEALRHCLEMFIRDQSQLEPQNDTQLLMNTLSVLEVMVETAPAFAFARDSQNLWQSVTQCCGIHDDLLNDVAAKLTGSYLSHLASASAKANEGLAAIPLIGSYGLELDASEMRRMCYACLKTLRTKGISMSEDCLTQTVRNLLHLGRCFAANDLQWRDDARSRNNDRQEEDEEEAAKLPDQSALGYLFNRLSYIIRQDDFPTMSRTAAVQAQMAILYHISSVPDLQTLVRPLYLLTDPSMPQPPGEAHKGLVDKARELLHVVQKKVGTEDFILALASERRRVKATREERRTKRRVEAVSQPERWARDKRRKHEVKKRKVKEKGMDARNRRRGW